MNDVYALMISGGVVGIIPKQNYTYLYYIYLYSA